jgi:hypothetical protein
MTGCVEHVAEEKKKGMIASLAKRKSGKKSKFGKDKKKQRKDIKKERV